MGCKRVFYLNFLIRILQFLQHVLTRPHSICGHQYECDHFFRKVCSLVQHLHCVNECVYAFVFIFVSSAGGYKYGVIHIYLPFQYDFCHISQFLTRFATHQTIMHSLRNEIIVETIRQHLIHFSLQQLLTLLCRNVAYGSKAVGILRCSIFH